MSGGCWRHRTGEGIGVVGLYSVFTFTIPTSNDNIHHTHNKFLVGMKWVGFCHFYCYKLSTWSNWTNVNISLPIFKVAHLRLQIPQECRMCLCFHVIHILLSWDSVTPILFPRRYILDISGSFRTSTPTCEPISCGAIATIQGKF